MIHNNMHNELINLLPQERQRALYREYVMRICVIIAIFTATLTLSAGVLLIPTYVFLNGNEKIKKMNLAQIESTLSSTNEAALLERIANLSANADTIIALSNSASVSSIFREMLSVSRPGISISGISFVPPTGKNPRTITISGLSATRDSLRNYQLALQETPLVLSATLPVSAYAKDNNIAFVITIILTP